nr:uncharacterized LOC128092247 homolog [Pan paniscus]
MLWTEAALCSGTAGEGCRGVWRSATRAQPEVMPPPRCPESRSDSEKG